MERERSLSLNNICQVADLQRIKRLAAGRRVWMADLHLI
jgi:hypothetical protein